jgi:anti-sigma regulatory factor (Ser/Thr protein kinase)
MLAGDDVEMEHRATFELAPEAASRARAVVNDELGRRAVPGKVLEDATLLVSELVTNAVRHAPRAGSPEVELRLKVDPERVRVVVSDPGAGFVAAARLPTASESSGWGLYLVDRIADRWGVISKDRNEVWFEIDVVG